MDPFSALLKEATQTALSVDAAVLQFQQATQEALLSPEKLNLVVGRIPFLIDWGHFAETYEACEALAAKFGAAHSYSLPDTDQLSFQCLDSQRILVRIYLGHFDLMRRRQIESHRTFFNKILQHRPLFVRAHAKSALGLVALFEGKLEESLASFREAETLFETAQAPVDALKMTVRQIMVLQSLKQQDDVMRIAEEALQRGLTLGVKAISPITYLYSCIGAALNAQGRRFESERRLRNAAKLARIMPPSHSGGFALFQYGHCLLTLNRSKDALEWLRTADEWQRTRDPIGRYATQIATIRCYRLLGQWDLAHPAARALLQNRNRDICEPDLEEGYVEIMEVFLSLQDSLGLEALERDMEDWTARRSTPAPHAMEFLEQCQKQIHALHESWRSCKKLPPTEIEATNPHHIHQVHVDFINGILVGQKGNSTGHCRVEFRTESSAAELLKLLCKARATVPFGISKRDLLQQQLDAQSIKAKPDSLRRQLDRVLQEFQELHIVEEFSHHNDNLICIAPRAVVFVKL